MIPRCPYSRKIQYPTQAIADQALLEIIDQAQGWRNHRRARPTGVYRCDQCTYWHLTHCNTASVERRSKKNSRGDRQR